jgi:hypothetical protein
VATAEDGGRAGAMWAARGGGGHVIALPVASTSGGDKEVQQGGGGAASVEKEGEGSSHASRQWKEQPRIARRKMTGRCSG